MSFNPYIPLNKLNPSKIKWEIQVRAQSVWKGITRDTKEFRGYNMLLIDDSNCRMHAFINARFAAIFEGMLEEGQMYRISRFTVNKYTGYESHRCVRSDHHIYFTDYTSMRKITVSIPRIPEYSFDIFDLVSLDKTTDDKRFLFDVIGVLKDREPIRQYVNDTQQEKKQAKFTITDGRCIRKVTFFDDFALQFDKAIEKQTDEIVVIIIACAKIGQYQGELNICNYPATRFYLNANHYSVKKLKKRASDPCFKEKVTVLREEPKEVVMTVSFIKQLKEDYVERRVTCVVTIKKVDEVQWFYHICPKCPEDLVAVDGRFKCSKYNRYIPYPERRFRISTLCADESGVIGILLGDSEVRQLFQKNVFEIDLEQAKTGRDGEFPLLFKELVGRNYTITLKIKKENVLSTTEVYDCAEIVEFLGVLEPYNNVLEASGETEDSSADMVTEVEKPPEEDSHADHIIHGSREKVRKKKENETNIVDDVLHQDVIPELLSEGKMKKSKKCLGLMVDFVKS